MKIKPNANRSILLRIDKPFIDMKIIIILITTILLSFTVSAQLTQEQRIVAQTILGEARGEGEAGMYAVACVIAQRSIAWGKTPTQVCLKKWQFSCWNPNDPNSARLSRLLNTPQATYAKRLAVNLTQLKRNYTKNADHYCTLATHPYWSYKKIKKGNRTLKVSIAPVAIIGNHKFYKLR